MHLLLYWNLLGYYGCDVIFLVHCMRTWVLCECNWLYGLLGVYCRYV